MIEVLPLEWHPYGHDTSTQWAGHPPLRYKVTSYSWGASLELGGSPIRAVDEHYWDTVAEAKEAAINDLRKRILPLVALQTQNQEGDCG